MKKPNSNYTAPHISQQIGVEMKDLTQREIVLQHLEKYGKISSLEASIMYGITRVVVPINKIELTHNIKHVWVPNGQKSNIDYTLIK